MWEADKKLRHRVTVTREWQQPDVPAYPSSFSSCFQIRSVPRDGCVCPLQTSKISPLFCPLAMAIRALLCWDLYSLFLCFFCSAPSFFVCFKEFSWRGSFASGGELSTPPPCRLCQVTAPSAAEAWTRLKKNITGIFNFPVWSWEMKSHHERSLPGAVSRWECQAWWETTEKYWSSIFIWKEFSSPALAALGAKLEYKMRSLGSYQQDNI